MTVILPLLLAVALLGGAWAIYEFLRQSGRILLRLEAIEQTLAQLTLARRSESTDLIRQEVRRPSPGGLPLGSMAPPFELPSLSGDRVSLSRFRGRRVLLAFFNPQCGFCTRLAPEFARLAPGDANGAPVIVVVTAGDPEVNHRFFSEHQIGATVLLQHGNEVAELYRAYGTPTGYLVDEEGRIASPLAAGADLLLGLAQGLSDSGEPRKHRGNLPLSASKLKRDGLTAGTPAPDFRLPRADGNGELALIDYRGRPVLLVFSDPHCGPCMALAPKLEELRRSTRDLEFLLVSRGNLEENRRRIAEHGLTFPVVLQKQWEVSRNYAMFATPVGYLVDESGVLASDVAIGEEAILAMASRAASLQSTEPEKIQMT